MAHPKLAVAVAVVAFVLLAASAGAAVAAAPWPHPATPAASFGPDAPPLAPTTVYRLVDRENSGPSTPETGAPNAVTAHSLRATSITPNAGLYVAALLIMAAALWAAVYRLGKRTL